MIASHAYCIKNKNFPYFSRDWKQAVKFDLRWQWSRDVSREGIYRISLSHIKITFISNFSINFFSYKMTRYKIWRRWLIKEVLLSRSERKRRLSARRSLASASTFENKFDWMSKMHQSFPKCSNCDKPFIETKLFRFFHCNINLESQTYIFLWKCLKFLSHMC